MRFGASIRHLWTLREDVTYLNHGAFGATPKSVLAAQQAYRDQMEAQPLDFFVRQLPGLTRAAADRLAAYVGAEQLLFVDNATTGVNAVLRSLDLRRGDRVVALSHVYPAVNNALRFVCDRAGAVLELVELDVPADADRLMERLDAALPARLAVLDHVTSGSGLVLPIQRMVRLCQAKGTPVLVDGAHAPAMLHLELDALGATWYTGNCHKWLCAPKGAALLHASDEGRAQLQPTVIGHGYPDVVDGFDFLGTGDYTPWLAVPAALDFREALGDQAAREYTHTLALQARELLLEALGTVATGPESMTASLVCLRMPDGRGDPTWEGAMALNNRLWHDHRVEVPLFPFDGALWIRVSAQVYNHIDQYRALAELL
jgi:isopenicillin-N epimerase